MTNRILLLVFLLLSLNCISQTTNSNDKFYKATMGRIEMSIPQGFEAIPNQNGYLHKGSASTILISQMENTPFSYADQHFTKENFEKGGAKIISTQKKLTVEGKEAALYTLTLNIASKDNEKTIEYERLILVTGNENTTVFIVANYPVVVKKIIEEPLTSSLLSVTLKSR